MSLTDVVRATPAGRRDRSREHRPVRALLVAGFILLSACTVPVYLVPVVAPQGYSIAFPGEVDTTAGRDGPVDYRIDAMRTRDGARFESAWFGLRQALDPPERIELLRRVERGFMAGVTRVVSRVQTPPGNADRVDLVLDYEDGRRGHYRVFYLTPKSMIQISAVGPRGGDWEAMVPGFFGSLKHRFRVPFQDVPVSARIHGEQGQGMVTGTMAVLLSRLISSKARFGLTETLIW